MIYLHLKCTNDNNGNPRRLFLVLDHKGGIVDAIDEGYRGRCAVTKKYPHAKQGPDIRTTPAERRDLLRDFSK